MGNQMNQGPSWGQDSPRPVNHDGISQLISRIVTISNRALAEGRNLNLAEAEELISAIQLLKRQAERGTHHTDWVRRFEEVVRETMTRPGCKVEDLCDSLGTSKSRLHARTKDMLGMTPMDYLWLTRLLVAARLLAETPHKVDVVAEQCGFRSGSHLSSRFKKRFGHSPGAWRRMGQKFQSF